MELWPPLNSVIGVGQWDNGSKMCKVSAQRGNDGFVHWIFIIAYVWTIWTTKVREYNEIQTPWLNIRLNLVKFSEKTQMKEISKNLNNNNNKKKNAQTYNSVHFFLRFIGGIFHLNIFWNITGRTMLSICVFV